MFLKSYFEPPRCCGKYSPKMDYSNFLVEVYELSIALIAALFMPKRFYPAIMATFLRGLARMGSE